MNSIHYSSVFVPWGDVSMMKFRYVDASNILFVKEHFETCVSVVFAYSSIYIYIYIYIYVEIYIFMSIYIYIYIYIYI